MKEFIFYILKAFSLLFMLMTQITASAQSHYAPLGETRDSAFELSIRNVDQTTDRTLEFDVYLLDANATKDFELATIQAGILINSSIFSGGTLFASLVKDNSTLNLYQSPEIIGFVDIVNGYSGLSLIKLASRGAPGAGNGTLLSSYRNGNFVAKIKLVCTVPFTPNTSPNLAFTSGTDLIPFYATRVAQYISMKNVQLEVIPGRNAIVEENPMLNPTMTAIDSGIISGAMDRQGNNGISDMMIFAYDKTVVIENRNNVTGVVTIYDLTGKEIDSQCIASESRILIPVQADYGFYIVKVTSSAGILSARVFIQ